MERRIFLGGLTAQPRRGGWSSQQSSPGRQFSSELQPEPVGWRRLRLSATGICLGSDKRNAGPGNTWHRYECPLSTGQTRPLGHAADAVPSDYCHDWKALDGSTLSWTSSPRLCCLIRLVTGTEVPP
jgi:hypothetical protein